MRLLLAVVLVAMAAAIVLPALGSYQRSEVEHRIQVAVAGIDAAARSVYHHPGSSRTVVVDVPPAGRFHLERLVIGGDPATDPAMSAVISWSHSGGTTSRHVVSGDTAPIPLSGPDGRALTVEGPRAVLVLEAKVRTDGPATVRYVEVREA